MVQATNLDLEHQALVSLFKIVKSARFLSPGDPVDVGALRLLGSLTELGPSRPSAIATEENLDLSTVSRHIAALESQGLLQKTPDPTDGRAFLVEPTQRARELLHEMVEVRINAISPALASWSAADRNQLYTLLIRLATDLREEVDRKRNQ